jgi:parallel beta-helix repeat protein
LKQEFQLTAQTPYSDTLIAQTGVADQKIVNIQSYSPHSSIWITSDTQLNSSNFKGNGTIDDPILIEGYEITDPSGTLIYIEDTTFYFQIRNNLLNGQTTATHGIYLENVTHATIANNIVFDSQWNGIEFQSSFNNTITKNEVYNIRSGAGIALYYSENNTITRNIAYNNNWDGIRLHSFNHNNTISHNVAYNNTWQGIRLEDNNFNCSIHNNTVYENKEDGIRLIGSLSNTISNNIAYDGSANGILLIEDSNNNSIFNNILYDNNYDGLAIGGTPRSHNNTVVNNTAYLNNAGISFSGNNNNISFNMVYNNRWAGISVDSSNHSIIKGNTAYINHGNGIYISDSNDNMIIENIVYDNSPRGIPVTNSTYNVFTKNLIHFNDEWGISFEPGADDNKVQFNDFSMNSHIGCACEPQALDQGINNFFSNNYWSDWTGIGSYTIAGDHQDVSPLTNPYHLSPPVITAPTSATTTLKDSVTIQWTASIDLYGHFITYTVSYSTNDGTTWVTLISGLTTTNYVWDLTNIKHGLIVLLKVQATDEGGFNSYSISTSSFTIDNPSSTTTTTTTATTRIAPGWDILLLILSLLVLVPLSHWKRKS